MNKRRVAVIVLAAAWLCSSLRDLGLAEETVERARPWSCSSNARASVTFLSQTPQGMMFMLTNVGTLRSLRALGFCAARATHLYRAHGTVTAYR
jgi:hypothetical protein